MKISDTVCCVILTIYTVQYSLHTVFSESLPSYCGSNEPRGVQLCEAHFVRQHMYVR